MKSELFLINSKKKNPNKKGLKGNNFLMNSKTITNNE